MTQNSSSPGDSPTLSFRNVCCFCQDIVAEISARHELNYAIPVKFLIEEAERRLGGPHATFKVNLHARSWGADRLSGLLLRYSERADIIYSQGFNTCWRRFVITKELAHLFLDNEESYTQDPVGLVQSLSDGQILNDRADMLSEHISPMAAIELLLPWSHRNEIYAMEKEGSSHVSIAQHCRVPQKIVTWVLSKSYRERSEAANK